MTLDFATRSPIPMAEVTNRSDGQSCEIDLPKGAIGTPVLLAVGPVLALDDAVGMKVAALHDRAKHRDFIDVHAAGTRAGHTLADLERLGAAHKPGFSAEELVDRLAAVELRALVGFRPVLDAGAEVRLHDTVLYNSIYRADGELLINAHVYGHPAAHAPVFHLHRCREHGMAATYLESFERVWAASCELHEVC